jgi:hypothetical protein
LFVKLSVLKHLASISDSSVREVITQKIDVIENSARFINDLNNQHIYFQMPISSSDGKNRNAELFIMKRGSKRRKINPDDTTMFISLSTNNMGLVESLIHVNNKNISINIRAANNKILDFFKDGINNLHIELVQRGYKLSRITYTLSEKKLAASNAIKEANKIFQLKGRSVLDYRV